jgi:hypothetical protein
MKKTTVTFVVMVAVGMMLLGAPSQGAAQYLGESTWTFSITQNSNGAVSASASMTGAISRTGGTYYTMQGYISLPDDGPFIMAGGGVLIGETLYLNLTVAQHHTDNSWRDTGVLHAQLNKTTLSGTFYEVGRDFQTSSIGPSPVFGNRFEAGTLTLTGTPISLEPGPDELYADFGSLGLKKYDGAWTAVTSNNPEQMLLVGKTLYVDLGESGLFKRENGVLSRIRKSNADGMWSYGNKLVVYFPSIGLYEYNGSTWKFLKAQAPEDIIAVDLE